MKQKELLEQAYMDFADPIFRFIYFRVFDRDSARDLTQEVFYKTGDYLMKGKDIENIQAFLYKTARNLIANSIRDKKPVSSLDELRESVNFDVHDTQHEDFVEDMRDLTYVLESFQILKQADSELMQLRYVEGLSIPEISEITNLSEGNISVKIHRSIQVLKDYHNQQHPNGKEN